jgi:uncharacterized protein YecE (DUF72 family)
MTAVSGDILVGTSGFSYDDWRGAFYPADLPKASMLDYYSRFFKIVEINATYYSIPSRANFERLAERTPDYFEFIVKTHQETTHRRRENAAALAKLTTAVQPLSEAGKLKGFLAQFPYSFKNNEINRKYLHTTRILLGDVPFFSEFRHDSWAIEPVEKFLADNNIGYVNVDEPALSGLMPPQDIVTNHIGYVRFHGRNGQKWWDGKGSDRYDYLYKESELESWLVNISGVLKKAFRAYIFFNNHPGGKAVKNAMQMIELLKK